MASTVYETEICIGETDGKVLPMANSDSFKVAMFSIPGAVSMLESFLAWGTFLDWRRSRGP